MRTASVALAALLLGFAWGVGAERYDWPPRDQARALLSRLAPDSGLRLGHNHTAGRVAIDCQDLAADTLVLLLFGQSNAANSGDARYPDSPRGVYNFNIVDGRCYEAMDPLLGTSSTGGSIWTRLGARIVERGIAPRVLLAPIAVSGSKISDWAPPGELSGRAIRVIDQLRQFGIPVAAALWQQGESDGRTPSAEYVAQFKRIAASMRAAGFDGRLIVSHSTRCGDSKRDNVRAANLTLANELHTAEMGPDLDQFAGTEFRHDACHLNDRGQQQASEQWLAALTRGPLRVPTR